MSVWDWAALFTLPDYEAVKYVVSEGAHEKQQEVGQKTWLLVMYSTSVCVCVSQRQKDREGEFNGVSQGEAPLFPLIKHAARALAP